MNTVAQAPPEIVKPPFASILCGVDGSRESKLAVHHALALATPGATLHLVSVFDERTRRRSEEAVRTAKLLARRAGVAVSAELVEHDDPGDVLLEAARAHDVLVVGTRRGSRAEGIVYGGTAALALHACDVPVLVARATPDWRALGEHVLVASDGSPEIRRAAELAGAIAARAGGRATLLHVSPYGSGEARRELALEATDILVVTGEEPVTRTVAGRPADAITGAADEFGATLLVLGSRGLTGVRALASVSERVGATAPCPVLVLRPRQPS